MLNSELCGQFASELELGNKVAKLQHFLDNSQIITFDSKFIAVEASK
ncbi:hypothetical protein BTN50_0036 [Candidatus Enterovibrio altilux]|uniref:Uncharacterized protein n=1 Tax=Candidatus Enterovibrio altilux TaxID=1927128 RepID=A0A291B6G3_9GAMM|nr:hypothetical protein BTN50_0036 [Candidatus Enterovibrio luxaltus]